MLGDQNPTASCPPSTRSRAGLTAALLAAGLALFAALALVAAGNARAASAIEGEWSFGGGVIAIQAQPDGTYIGTVVAPTTFEKCEHTVGELIWQHLAPQADGSFWGTHQWFYDHDGNQCEPLGPGNAAFRILTLADGSKYLKVCLDEPGSGQPYIAAEGSSNAQKCFNSNLVAPLPTISPNGSATAAVVSLPDSQQCIPRRKLRIRLHDPQHDPLKTISVTLRSGTTKKVATIERKKTSALATFDLTDLTAPTFTVRVSLTTILGSHLRGKRKYSLCVSPTKVKPPKVHR